MIASRLSENPSWKILLVEAGGDPSFTSDVPAFLFSTQETEMDWKYVSEKHEGSCLGMIDQKCANPRGRVLGGSSVINAMMYVRGNPRDYDEWKEMGNDEWDYENVLKFFKKSENLNGYYLTSNGIRGNETNNEHLKGKVMSEEYHSASGPLSVTPYASGSLDFLKNAVFKAFEELGLPSLVDFNGKSQIGISNCPGTLVQGTRANAAKMFLNPVKDRPNLFVVKNAVAEKLIIKNNKVEGVQFIRNNETKIVKVRKEVVVSAGAINSPQLLLLSGVGPKSHLESLGIPVVLDLEGVGQNLQDHFLFLGNLFSVLKSKSEPLQPLVYLDAMYMFLTKRIGLLSSIGLTDVTGFVDTKNNGDVPDTQFVFYYAPKEDSYLLPEIVKSFRFNDDLKQQHLNFSKQSGVLMIAPVVLKPKGRGRIELRSRNVMDPPKIFTDILKDEADRAVLLRGIKFISELRKTASFKMLEPELLKFNIAECNEFVDESDDYWMCVAKYMTSTLYHPVGTCKMGPKTDSSAVVDNRLRVHGIDNLRIADASIMPTIVRGNTNAPCIMIGEKCADFIKEDWKKNFHNEL